jgi:hypothetical protein
MLIARPAIPTSTSAPAALPPRGVFDDDRVGLDGVSALSAAGATWRDANVPVAADPLTFHEFASLTTSNVPFSPAHRPAPTGVSSRLKVVTLMNRSVASPGA